MKLLNATNRTRVFNLEAEHFRAGNGGRPGALTMAPRERAEVHDQASECAEVASALRNGTLRDVTATQAEAPRGKVRAAREGAGRRPETTGVNDGQ